MYSFNKVEAIGIFVSVSAMALVLAIIRFQTDALVAHVPEGDTQSAVVAVSDQGSVAGEKELREALTEAHSADGTLVKLVTDDVKIGTGKTVAHGDTVTVHYVGTLQDGTKFDSSYERGETFSFTIGEGRVIEGWEKGLIGMKERPQRILVIPGNMAYGNRQVGMIPANATLVFAVELISIK